MSKIGRTYEEVWDQRSIRIDPEKNYSYQTAYDSKKGKDNIVRHAAIRGIHDRTLLNQLFFSEKNIKNIQNKLRYTIYKMSNGQFTIGPQNEDELAIIMRSIYLQYSRNMPDKIKEQIAELNNIVVDQIAPEVLGQTKQYIKYLEDINSPWKLMERPQNISSAGSKTLEIHSALGFGDPKFKPFQ
jgi:hypothetical protein